MVTSDTTSKNLRSWPPAWSKRNFVSLHGQHQTKLTKPDSSRHRTQELDFQKN